MSKPIYSKGIAAVIILHLILSVATATSDSNKPQQAFLSPSQILNTWQKNYGSIGSMEAQWAEEVVKYKIPDSAIQFTNIRRIEQGKRYHEYYSQRLPGLSNSFSVWEYSFDGDIAGEFYWFPGEMKTNSSNIRLMPNVLKKYMLMEESAGDPIFPDEILNLGKILEKAIAQSAAKVFPYLEIVAGQSCHKLEIAEGNDPNIFSTRLWVAQDKGMLPLKCERYYQRIDENIEIEQIASVQTNGKTVWYPAKARRISGYGNTYELTVKLFIPNPPLKDEDLHIQLPLTAATVQKICGISDPAMAEKVIDVFKMKVSPDDPASILYYISRLLFDYAKDHNNLLPDSFTIFNLKSDLTKKIKTDIEYVAPNKKVVYDGNNQFVPVAYDKTMLKKGQGTYVLCLDAHVEFVEPARLKKFGIDANASMTNKPEPNSVRTKQ